MYLNRAEAEMALKLTKLKLTACALELVSSIILSVSIFIIVLFVCL